MIHYPHHRQPDRIADPGGARLGLDEPANGRSDLRAEPRRLVTRPRRIC